MTDKGKKRGGKPLLDFGLVRRVVFFEKGVYREIRDNPSAIFSGLTVLLLSVALGTVRLGSPEEAISSVGGTVVYMAMAPAFCVTLTFILYLTSKILWGRSGFLGYLKVIAFAQAPVALMIIPVIGGPVGLTWMLLCVIAGTREAHEFSTTRALLATLPLTLIVAFTVLASLYIGAPDPELLQELEAQMNYSMGQ